METDSAITIDISAEADADDVDPEQLRCAAATALALSGQPLEHLSIAIVDDAQMVRLHNDYLSINAPTDVLAFDLRDRPDAPVDGQVIVSVDTARRESASRDLALADELLLYVIHGCLHLCGYDDKTPEGASRMYAQEEAVLKKIGIAPIRSVS